MLRAPILVGLSLVAIDRIAWTLDGRSYFTVRRRQLKRGQTWPFDHPFYVLLNLAVGGDWPGPPTDHTHFPATMLIDWIRVQQST